MRRVIYLLYYFKQTDYKKLWKFVRYATDKTAKPGCRVFADAVCAVFRYNISILDYFYFRFFELEKSDRKTWAGTGYLYEYQLAMNPKKSRELLENKIQFLDHFGKFVNRRYYSLKELKENVKAMETVFSDPAARLVLKNSRGQVGAEVEVISVSGYTADSLINYMSKKDYDLLEEYVVQHPSIMKLSPSGLNTVRIFTQVHDGSVSFLGARLRISVNSTVDNMGAGNLAAPVDLSSGIVCGPGVYSDITKDDTAIHPVTGIAIEGFQIPFWSEVMKLAEDAALFSSENKSVGWDIAITKGGPQLIEGNHNWCKLLWQLPVKQGLKNELSRV
ncbi:MAG: sugar-transfer associated ATP-grasp domain-containing protein [Bacteroidales bacterium]|nr:sugar-transfer associated ATP-grasp domain-containing protein [Bacteroidales bacterium]